MNLFDLNLTLPISDPTWVFFLVLIIILFAPMILGRLHIPHIIGMILAGVLIGEHGFHVLDRDSSFELFGKVGLYYIMFLAGLEMDMEDFKKNRTKSFVFGCSTGVSAHDRAETIKALADPNSTPQTFGRSSRTRPMNVCVLFANKKRFT